MQSYQKYEHYCCDVLINKDNYSRAWTWQNIPENKLLDAKLINNFEQLRLERKHLKSHNLLHRNPLQDNGIDLLAETENGEFLVGQSKYYSGNNTLNRNELAGFFEYLAMPDLQRHKFVVYYTTDLCRRIRENMACGRYGPNLQFVKLQMPDDYVVPANTRIVPSSTVGSISLRDYQLEAINRLKEYFASTKDGSAEFGKGGIIETCDDMVQDDAIDLILEDAIEETDSNQDESDSILETRKAGILSMPGGTGKTEVFLTFARDNYKYCVVLSPTRELARQTLEDRAKRIYSSVCYFKLIDSEGSRDITTLRVEISEAMVSHRQIVISSTFRSCDVVLELLPIMSGNIDDLLLIVDEFHDIPKPAVVNSSHVMNRILISTQRVLYVSATPRCYAMENVDAEGESDSSMSEYLFGEKIYEFSFKRAVELGYICDYQLWLPSVWHTQDNENQLKSLSSELLLDVGGFEKIERDRYLKMTLLVNWMLQLGLRRVITYVLPDQNGDVSSAESECELLSKIFADICEKYQAVKCNFGTILGNTSHSDRRLFLNSFVKDGGDCLSVLFNCRVLDEGVDLPPCDGIFIAYGSQDKVRNVQRLYRCLRRYGKKDKGHCLYWGDDESKAASFLSSLAEYDEDYRSKIRIQSTYYGEKCDVSVQRKYEKATENQTKIDELVVKAIPYSIFLEIRQNALLDFLRTYGRVPKYSEIHTHDDHVVKVGAMYSTMKLKGAHKDLMTKLITEFPYVRGDIKNYKKSKEDKIVIATDTKYNVLVDFLKSPEGCDTSNENDYFVTIINEDAKSLNIKSTVSCDDSITSGSYQADMINGSKGKVLQLLDIIDVNKINRELWIKIGIVLKNVYGEAGLEHYDNFSRKFADCYNKTELLKDWESIKPNQYSNITEGTLHYCAKTTNFEGYVKYIIDSIDDKLKIELLHKCFSFTHGDVARFIYLFVENRLLHTQGLSSNSKLWFIYQDHNWTEGKGVTKINGIIENEVLLYLKYALNKVLNEIDICDDDEKKNKLEQQRENLDKLIRELNTTTFINNVVSRLYHKLYQPEAFQLFDQQTHLIGCSNGVFDLQTLKFRPGRQNDYILTTTGIDYIIEDQHGLFGVNHPHIRGINQFMNEIHPNPNTRKYLKLLLGSCLGGRNIKEQLYLLTGCGSNGKSKLFELVGYALGKYASSINMSYFTGKKSASSQASPEVAHIANARFVSASETEKGEKMNIDILKNISGNDKITYRNLHQPIRETIPKFTILFSVNHLPELPPEDDAVWRRIRVIKFETKFVDNPDPNFSNEVQKDINLHRRLQSYKHAMLWLMFEWYKEFLVEGLSDIPEVLMATNNYRNNLDPVKPWLLDNLLVTGDTTDYVPLKILKQKLVDEEIYREMFKKDKDFTDYLQIIYPQCRYVKTKIRLSNGDRPSNSLLGIKFATV